MARNTRNPRDQRGGGRRRDNASREESEIQEKLVHINRVAKVVKGGRRFGFSALVIVGDGKGRVGHGSGKAREVPTLHHDVDGRFGAGRVVLRSAPAGTGIIAGGPMRAVFEMLGVSDVVAKSIGTSNPHNMIKATFAALTHCASPRQIASKRGKKVGDIVGRRGVGEEAREAIDG